MISGQGISHLCRYPAWLDFCLFSGINKVYFLQGDQGLGDNGD
jgi:hypothetical protein